MSSKASTLAGRLNVTVTAHAGTPDRLLMFSVECDGQSARRDHALDLALVLDTSGSMSGPKIEIAKRSTAEFIRSLRARDRVSVVSFSNEATVVAPRSQPSEGIARLVDQVAAHGGTNLYGGWLTAAKLTKPGGRIVLLSDGQANDGRYRNAFTLHKQAAITYESYKVATSTIGVGEDYDEAIMAGMARSGSGGHYFAHSAAAIREAFGQERYSMGGQSVGFVSIRVGNVTLQLGQFFAGERKNVVIPVSSLDTPPPTVRYRAAGENVSTTCQLEMPTSFGHSDEASLEYLIANAAALEDRAVEVTDRDSAGALHGEIRKLILKFMAHPLADGALGSAALTRLHASLERLANLMLEFSEIEASMHRKRSMQSSYNYRERMRSYSSFAEDQLLLSRVHEASVCSKVASAPSFDPRALQLFPHKQWREWGVVPLKVNADVLVIGTEDKSAGFLFAELEAKSGRTIDVVVLGHGEVERLLNSQSGSVH